MKAILAVNRLGYIGLDGDLPWGRSCTSDLLHFKRMTVGGTLLCGPNTYQKLPPLKDRRIIVWDRNEWKDEYLEADWCIGGKRTYERFSPLFTELHISIINDYTIGDTYAPFLYSVDGGIIELDKSLLNPKCRVYTYEFNLD